MIVHRGAPLRAVGCLLRQPAALRIFPYSRFLPSFTSSTTISATPSTNANQPTR